MNKIDILKRIENTKTAIESHKKGMNEVKRLERLAKLMLGTLNTIAKEDVFHAGDLANAVTDNLTEDDITIHEKVIDLEANYVNDVLNNTSGWHIVINNSHFLPSEFMVQIAQLMIKLAFKAITKQKVFRVDIV